MKFDVVIANPPYQAPTKNKGAGHTLWDKFVEKAFELCSPAGYVVMIHPSGWRNVSGAFSKVGNLLRSKDMKYLEMHSVEDGYDTFKCGTRFDWHVTCNQASCHSTSVCGESGEKAVIDLSNFPLIPNGLFSEVEKLFSGDKKGKVNVLYSRSAYASDRKGTSKTKGDGYLYPCVQHMGVKGKPTCMHYSDTDQRGHFGVPKVIFASCQVGGTMVDRDGEYGMCEHCAAIKDFKKNLPLIKAAMDSSKFIQLIKMCDVGGNRDRYNRKAIALFRKDFWKEFVDEEGNEK